MADSPRRHEQHRRRHVRGAADRLPDLGQQRLREPAEGRDGDRGRLRPRRRDATRRRSRRPATTCSRSRRSTARAPAVVGGGDMVVMFKDTPAVRGARSRTWRRRRRRRSGRSAAASRRRTRTSPASAYPDPITRTTATALAKAQTFRFDMSDLQPAAFGGTVGQGEFKTSRTSSRTRRTSTGRRGRAREAAAKKAYKRRATNERWRASRRSLPPTEAPPPPRARAGRRRTRVDARASSRRRRSSSASGSSTRRLHGLPQLLRPDRDDEFVWFDNYKAIFTTQHRSRRRSRTTRSGSPSSRPLVTAIGLDLRGADRAGRAGRSRSRPRSSCRWRSRCSPPA